MMILSFPHETGTPDSESHGIWIYPINSLHAPDTTRVVMLMLCYAMQAWLWH
ncbi:hypothetical protein BDV23DRAFT_154190 [Aspergillus alliaceus]|uniref:Uncharacterized protein n=1 Tax=Petromyces alliaceus TaxID=209559 RepID=A0A5N7C9X3_PETAA|nr:hypothetical protein BDV23DRAFT_154190 [Aspergillus alliaceus]